MVSKIRAYYRLTKPGIIYGNLLMLVGGYFYGARGDVDTPTLVGLILGTALVIACGCVINNYLDQDLDALMRRTKKRAIASGQVLGPHALIYATLLGAVGFSILGTYTNSLTVVIGAVGLSSYALVYTYLKRHTIHATLIGTVPGATPPLAGYAAATGVLDVSAWLLFMIMVFWQMVHFYAIAIYRRSDYKKAGIPVMPVVRGVRPTIYQMLAYGVGFVVSIYLLASQSYAKPLWLVVMLPMALWWLWLVFRGLSATNHTKWAKTVFLRSLPILPTMAVLLAINYVV